MIDIAGKTLMNGQTVAFNPPRYKGLVKGKVVGFTEQMVRVEYKWFSMTKTLCWPKDLAIIE